MNQENDNYLRERYKKYLIRERHSENTICAFMSQINIVYDYFSDLTQVTNDTKLFLYIIDGDMIADYFDMLRGLDNKKSTKQLSQSTINQRIASLQGFYNYIINKRQENIKNPILEVKQEYVEAPMRLILRKDELTQIIQATYTRLKGDRLFDFNSMRNRFILGFLSSTGCRISELLDTVLDDIEYIEVDGENAVVINIQEDRTKNHLAKRLVIGGQLLKYYDDYIEQRNLLLLNRKKDINLLIISDRGVKMTNASVNNMIKKYKNISGVLRNEKFTCHNFRHTCATMMSNNKNINIYTKKRTMGWKIKTIDGRYCHTTDLDILQATKSILE